ncbi:MAG: TMEM165/GDT1 family protein [Clostridia bacterium]
MGIDLTAFLISAGVVVLAEMGDKTQLLAMALATRYAAWKVMVGVFVATVLNHALAVLLGSYITHFEGLSKWISVVAYLSFLFFGLWTIRGDSLDGEQNRKTKYGAIITVAIAFFIAELGDKTQLATIALAAQYPQSQIQVLMGTTTGMLIADAFGIIIGVVLHKQLPERMVKFVSAGAFIAFGFIGGFAVLTESDKFNLDLMTTFSILGVLAIVTGLIAWKLVKTELRAPDQVIVIACDEESDAEAKL